MLSSDMDRCHKRLKGLRDQLFLCSCDILVRAVCVKHLFEFFCWKSQRDCSCLIPHGMRLDKGIGVILRVLTEEFPISYEKCSKVDQFLNPGWISFGCL